MSDTIGNIALNMAFILYLVHYFPQLLTNRKVDNLEHLSLHFHGMLSICYLGDLIYGFGMGMPWQYRCVSTMGSCCLLIQHWQLHKIHHLNPLYQKYSVALLVMLLLFLYELLFEGSQSVYLTVGYLSHLAGIGYLIPVLFNNWVNKLTHALNWKYVSMNWLCYFLNCISAYCLQWPMPSKIGLAFGLFCLTSLLCQGLLYRSSTELAKSVTK